MAGRNRLPQHYRSLSDLVEPPVMAKPKPVVLTRNPYHRDYVINGCPVHSYDRRWVHQEMFHKDEDLDCWVCEICQEPYTDDQVRAVLNRDEIREHLLVLNWPILYSWAGDFPDGDGFAHKCPKCGSMKTSFGTVTNTSRPKTAVGSMMRWYCHKCAHIFDIMDLQEYWDIIRPTPLEDIASKAAWEEEERLAELYGTSEQP
jgi:hypothetical protein